jgi:hypothetical protein
MRDSIHFKRDKQMQQMPNFLLSPKKHAETTQGQPVAKPKAKSKSANSKRLAPLRCWRSLSFSPGFCKNHLFEPKKGDGLILIGIDFTILGGIGVTPQIDSQMLEKNHG